MPSDKPSLIDSVASGICRRNSRTSGTASTLPRLGGKPIATRPVSAPRMRPSSSRALDLVQDAAPMFEQQLAGLGGQRATAVTHQQALMQLDLDRPHLAAQRRLRHVQGDRGPGKAA